LFTHLFFWGFFIFVLAVYSIVYKKNKLRTLFLLGVSLFFYFKTSGLFILLLLFTIFSDYTLGKQIHKNSDQKKRKLFLTISVVLNLSFLCFFKYAYFFTESYNQVVGTDYKFFNYF
jgi:D-alanyl-lipoteichoic acid acyltransferase DltB (MBOAT superfamily)